MVCLPLRAYFQVGQQICFLLFIVYKTILQGMSNIMVKEIKRFYMLCITILVEDDVVYLVDPTNHCMFALY